MTIPSSLNIRNPKCKLCDLHASARHICVIGRGPVSCRLMFIGEAPGEEEDKAGEPFVGRTGHLLDSIFFGTDIKREEVFISNAVKCHPLFNTKPNINMMEICSSTYLAKEIEIVQPELIICLGGIAAKTLLQDNNIPVTSARNIIHYTKGPLPPDIPFIVTFHPAATFHNPEWLSKIVEDIEWAKRLLAGENKADTKVISYQKLDSISDIPNIKKAKVISIDLETDGLDAFLPDKGILSLQITTREGNGYYFDWNRQIAKSLRELLRSNSVHILNGHNTKFDIVWLRSKADIQVNLSQVINDTIQNIHLLDENYPDKSLDSVATAFTPLKGHKKEFVSLINMYIKVHKEKKEPISKARTRLWARAFKAISIDRRIAYGCGDSDATHRLRRVFLPRLKEHDLLPLHNLMCGMVKMYADMEYNGIKVDESLLAKMDIKYAKKVIELRKDLEDMVDVDTVDNHNSPKQLQYLLYHIWKLPNHEIRQGRKRVSYSTGKDALELLLKDNIEEEQKKYISKLLEFRKTGKKYSTYIQGLPRFIREGSLIHASWNLAGAETGRTSCHNPNLQQIPRKGEVKELFISRFKDGVLMQIDCSQGELRIAAQESKEPNLVLLFQNSADIHRAVAASSLHKMEDEVTEDERFEYKTVDFLILYGGGVRTLAQLIKKSNEQAAIILRRWHRTFPGWLPFTRQTEKEIIDNGYVRSLLGRYRHIHILDPNSKEGYIALKAGVNAKIQGGLSDYNKLCGYRVWQRIQGLPILFVGETHDSWLIDMRAKYVDKVSRIVKEEFEHPNTEEFGFKFIVPMRVDAKVGGNWKELEEI